MSYAVCEAFKRSGKEAQCGQKPQGACWFQCWPRPGAWVFLNGSPPHVTGHPGVGGEPLGKPGEAGAVEKI